MDTQALDLFVAVAHAGGFAAVAKERLLDPSTVSRVIAGLEAELNVRLFQRTTRSLSLTEAGALYLARIEPLLDEMRRAAAEASNVNAEPRGVLRLTASVAFGVQQIAPLVGEFCALYPGLKLDCVFTDANLDLVQERMDLAIRLAPAIEGDLVATRLFSTRYHVVASPDYIARAAPIAEPRDLLTHRCLLLGLRAFRSTWKFRDAHDALEEVSVDGDVVISTPLALRAAVLSGGGPALLSGFLIADDLRAGRLVDLFPDHRPTPTTFDTGAWAIYPSRAYLPNKVRVMIDFLRSRLS
ncbi:LysR family transcriptional regulator [Asticcacaulis sp. DXS10W]|jgi:DNA-binding transcriptional LysR family regulator|uniref:LysR family transcriptional regulator n=1 Tax=Asticcacaulis currens TaxID=2984210 RepID=A0ABT5IDD3_9CAUL|nr:LysR family transcriptional regulator [Asticcacaulis currens]MDC7694187.1 LysR family transcriptional regulator [Asticcacaulis currens]